ncbi:MULTISPECIES: hypothetical protein [unclassified Cyanobium]|nr:MULTISPECIES: hypothetical protein [unclassified Cyanobium]
MAPALVLDASAALRLITHDPIASGWAEQLGVQCHQVVPADKGV